MREWSSRAMTWRAGLALVLASLLADSVAADPQNFTLVERGRYLVTLADCEACHDRPDSDATFAGGRSIETPFGKLRASNITPDKDTGIGAWTNDQFDDALRHGRRPDGARLYPAMPYNYYTRMSRDDANAIRAYLATVPPVRHRVESNTLPFPFRIRAVMRLWDALYQKEGQFRPDPSKSAEWNRGAFIVTGPGHCGACHTPKSLFGGDKDDEFLHGSLIQDWFAPDITNNEASGVGRWAVDDVVAYLKSGHNRVSAATGPMAEEVARASSRATDADLRAIAVYLKSLPGDTEAHPADAPTPSRRPEVPFIETSARRVTDSRARVSTGCFRRSPTRRWSARGILRRSSASCYEAREA